MRVTEKIRSRIDRRSSLWTRGNRPFAIQEDLRCRRKLSACTNRDLWRRTVGDRDRDDPEDMLESSLEDLEEWEAEHGGGHGDAS